MKYLQTLCRAKKAHLSSFPAKFSCAFDNGFKCLKRSATTKNNFFFSSLLKNFKAAIAVEKFLTNFLPLYWVKKLIKKLFQNGRLTNSNN